MGKYVIRFLVYTLTIIVDVCHEIEAFFKHHFNPPRTWRLKGFIEFVATKVQNFLYTVKSWCYEMFARWHIDSYCI